MLVCLQRFVCHCNGCIRFLEHVATSDDTASAPWASDLLKFLTHRDNVPSPKNLLLLALIADLVEVCSRLVPGAEAGMSHRHHIAHTSSVIHNMERELSDLFDIKTDSGASRLPLVMSKTYIHGYVNDVRKCLTLGVTTSLTPAVKIAWYRKGSSEQKLKFWVVDELCSLLHVKNLFLATIQAEFHTSIAVAMTPFDIEVWRSRRDDQVTPTLEPLATALRIDLGRLSDQFVLAFPAAVRLYDAGWRELDSIWGEVMRHTNPRTTHKFVELGQAARFILAAFQGTGEAASNFADLQAMGAHLCAGVDINVLTPCMKVVLDGPPLSEFVRFATTGCNQTYQPTALIGRSQNWYRLLADGRKFSHNMSDTTVVDNIKTNGDQKVSSRAETLLRTLGSARWARLHQQQEPMEALVLVDDVEESQSHTRTDAQNTSIHDCMHKDLKHKKRQLPQDAEPQCMYLSSYIQMGERICYIPARTTSGLYVTSVFAASGGTWSKAVAA
jgi:hypothetical protein